MQACGTGLIKTKERPNGAFLNFESVHFWKVQNLSDPEQFSQSDELPNWDLLRLAIIQTTVRNYQVATQADS